MKNKKIYIFSILLALFTLLSSYSNLQNTVIENINTAFSTGNITAISPYINNNIGLSFDDTKYIYSKSQSEAVLKDFFQKEKIKSYSIKKRSNNQNTDELYLICEYISQKNNYLVFLNVKREANKYKINEIHFQSQ